MTYAYDNIIMLEKQGKMHKITTVDQNIIGAPKMRTKKMLAYYNFSNTTFAILDFSSMLNFVYNLIASSLFFYL